MDEEDAPTLAPVTAAPEPLLALACLALAKPDDDDAEPVPLVFSSAVSFVCHFLRRRFLAAVGAATQLSLM